MSSDKQNDLTFPTLPFKDKVYRFVLNMVSDSMDAEDIMQDLLVKIWRRIEQYQEIENKEAWCMTVAKNLAIDKIRARKAPTTDVSEHYNLSDKSATPDQAYEQEEKMTNIMKLLDELPEKQKMIIHLRDVEGYTYQEIADMTENTLDFVKVSLHRARKALKDKLIQSKLHLR